MKVRLLKHLSAGSKTAGQSGTVAAAQGPPQAHQFISLLLEEYSALCQAARTISSFLLTLVSLPSRDDSFSCPVGGIKDFVFKRSHETEPGHNCHIYYYEIFITFVAFVTVIVTTVIQTFLPRRRMSTFRNFRWHGSCTTSTFLRIWCSLSRSCTAVYLHWLHSWSKTWTLLLKEMYYYFDWDIHYLVSVPL